MKARALPAPRIRSAPPTSISCRTSFSRLFLAARLHHRERLTIDEREIARDAPADLLFTVEQMARNAAFNAQLIDEQRDFEREEAQRKL